MKTLLALALALLTAVPAAADVTVGYESASGGYRGVGASETRGERSISGLKSRDESNTRFTGSVLKHFGGKKGRDAVSIVRVDLGKTWRLDPANKTYTELPISAPEPKEREEEQQPGRQGKEEKPTHRIKSAKAEVKATGKTKDVHGFKAAEHVATLTVVVEDLKTKKTAEYTMVSRVWTTPWTKTLKAARAEESAFEKAYLKKLGVDLSAADQRRFGLAAAAVLLSAGGPELEKALAKLGRELSKIDGYAVMTDTEWRAPAPPAAAKEPGDEEGSAVEDAAGSGSLGGAAASLLGGWAKRAAEKKVQQAAGPEPGKAAISVHTEVTKVDTSAVPADRFEIPKGYKKKG